MGIKNISKEILFGVAIGDALGVPVEFKSRDTIALNSVKGQVKSQETGKLSKWTELVVDHRQPNTFSIIVDRFKELNRINLEEIEYSSNEQNHIIFKDENLTKDFRKYHKEKASLRVVRKECNSGRTGMGRIKRSTKDLTIK